MASNNIITECLPAGSEKALALASEGVIVRWPKPAFLVRELAGNGGPVLASPMRNSGSGFGGGFGRGIGGAPGGRGGYSFGGRGMQGRPDHMIGKSITIARGPYK